MTRSIVSKGTWEQHLAIAQYLQSKGLTAQTTVAWFKAQHYIVKGVKFEAVRVSAMIAGLETSSAPAVVADPVGIINAQLTDGTLKYTKAKLVHLPKVVVPAVVIDVDDAPPF